LMTGNSTRDTLSGFRRGSDHRQEQLIRGTITVPLAR
jgi:hypothetical protein